MDYSLAQTECARIESIALSTDLTSAQSSKSAQADLRRYFTIREIRANGLKKRLSELIPGADLKQIVFGTVAPFVSRHKVKGLLGDKERARNLDSMNAICDENLDFLLSSLLPAVDGKPAPLGVVLANSVSSPRPETMTEYSKYRVHVWNIWNKSTDPDVKSESDASIATKSMASITSHRMMLYLPLPAVPPTNCRYL